jgi:quinol monooxygenase YgiN
MYARTTTVRGNPKAMDAAIAFVRDEWLPTTAELDGCTGLSMLVGRRSGRCIVTSGWADEQAMLDSAASMRASRARLGKLLGAVPVVAQWEIAVLDRLHPTGPDAVCRVVWSSRPEPSALDDDVATFRMALLPRIEELTGYCSASLMIDRVSGATVLAVAYADRDAMLVAGQRADALRAEYARAMGGRITEVTDLDLAVAHLRVPATV